MCGIVGLYLKTPGLKPKLGALFAPMLVEMSSRGPNSAGFAIYRNPVEPGEVKLTLASDDAAVDWPEVAESIQKTLECTVRIEPIASHAVLVTDADERAVMASSSAPTRISGWSGRAARRNLQGGRAAGRCGPPFEPGAMRRDACHRPYPHGDRKCGDDRRLASFRDRCRSLPRAQWLAVEPQRLRENLMREGIEFQTENDTEVPPPI